MSKRQSRQVYVVPHSDRYHTNRGCQGLQQAYTVFERSRSELADELDHCRLCSGEITTPDTDSFETRRLLEELDPDDIG
ncbi:hypothetical protein [Halopiger thermotolerans]